MRSSLLFDLTIVIELFHLFDGLLHERFDQVIEIAVFDFLDTILKVTAAGSKILAVDSSREHSNLRMRDTCGTSGGANAAHDTVEGFFCAFFEIAALSVSDVLHNVEALRASLGTSVATDTSIDFGVELHHDCFVYGNLIDVVNFLDQGEEGQCCDVHIVLNLRLASEACLELFVTLDTVDGCTSAAEAVTASAASDELIAGVFHCRHDRQIFRHLIFFAEKKDIN